MAVRYFRVGGAVRDWIMGQQPKDVDYVVTGASENDLISSAPFGLAFTKIEAQNFPVYHDQNGDEWALARREQKEGSGYHGFTVEFGPEVSIEEDIARRDITINSMAIEVFDDSKTRILNIIDPYGGQKDIRNKILRHTTGAFAEDPVRVLRLARFRARFGSEWVIAQETKDLIYTMSRAGTLNELTPERVWKEMSRALMEPHPRLFFDTLMECDVLNILFPEIYRLATALESLRWHPEGNAYEHSMLVLTQAAKFDLDLEMRFAALVHDFGKGITPRIELPKHYGHDVKGVKIVENFSNRLTVPSKIRDRSMKSTRYHMIGHLLEKINAKTFVKMFDAMGALNDPHSVTVLYCVCMCDERGRLGSENNKWDHLNKLTEAFHAYKSVKFTDVFPNGETNVNKINQGMFNARVLAVKSVM
jgi:tRNA nucleotidyltransferase (CCA-adding enzyme)